MRIDDYARYALLGALVASLACARNSEKTDDPSATGSVTTADTGAAIRVRPDTGAAGADTVQGKGTEGAPADEPRDTVRAAGADSAGWPSDTTNGGWSTPMDSL